MLLTILSCCAKVCTLVLSFVFAIVLPLLVGQSSNFSTSFQAPLRDSSVTYNGSHATATSDLPQLTGEDLKILDAFDHMQGSGDQLGPFVYQQTPLNYNMTM